MEGVHGGIFIGLGDVLLCGAKTLLVKNPDHGMNRPRLLKDPFRQIRLHMMPIFVEATNSTSRNDSPTKKRLIWEALFS